MAVNSKLIAKGNVKAAASLGLNLGRGSADLCSLKGNLCPEIPAYIIKLDRRRPETVMPLVLFKSAFGSRLLLQNLKT